MGNVKPWQIILFVAAIGVLAFSVWKFGFTGGPDLPDSVLLVDVKTGDLFELDIGGRKAAYYPEKHPDTGERTLMPVVKEDDGSWKIGGRMLPALQDVPGETPAVTDPSSGTVSVNDSRPRRIRL
jgi:hypothetical protein|tara:strand:+ start:16638 stop:17012 length:375 start_codon:yes stop_codon:yes gene_type:complete